MTTTPKVTIIIPVYNVEQYLRQCLNSVVNQTMREIQIICVNDGSPDNSLAILQEYAARDSRIEIIDKPNGGLSSARNAAYPSIKGKQTLFVDSDDWIDLDLCEKTYQKAKETNADMTLFSYQGESEQGTGTPGMFRTITSEDKTTVKEKLPVLHYPVAWGKLWRTDFLLDNKLYFPEGLAFEDNLVNWQAVTLADKISVVPEQLYHYRIRSGSIVQTRGKHMMDIIPIYVKIREYLLESDYYATYRDEFIQQKLYAWHNHYHGVPRSLKPRYRMMVRDGLSVDDREFYRSAPEELVRKIAKKFYAMLDGGPLEAVNYHFSQIIFTVAKVVKMPKRLLLQKIIKRTKDRLGI